MRRPLFFAALFLGLSACPPVIDTGNDGGGVISVGPEGGRFIREGAYIDFPKGAVTGKANITVSLIDVGIPEVPGRKRISMGYRITPKDLIFKTPVTIAVYYLEDRVPKGVDPGTFDQRRSTSQDAYLAMPGATTLPPLVVARTDRTGLFWATSPEQAAVSKVLIDPAEAFLKVGDTKQFAAQVTDPAGNPLEVATTWTVVPPRVATIDATGLLTATGPGTATVTVHAAAESATATVYVQGTATGPKTFVHENPFPTGNDLWGGALVGGSAVFVGGNATVLARSAANQWTRLFSTPAITLRAIAGTTPDDAVAVGVSGTSGVLVEMKGTSTPPVVTTLQTVVPRAMWFDGTYGMAVGEGNDVLVRRSGAWVTAYSPSVETLLAVVGDHLGAFTTLGNRGSLYQFDPATKTWNSLYQTQLPALLTAGALVNPQGTEAWAAGGNKLWHFTGGSWTALNLPGAPVMSELTTLGLLDGRIVIGARSARQGYLMLYDPAAEPATDGGALDAGALDAGALDAGALDAGAFDAGAFDAGAFDAGDVDAGPVDAGDFDAGVLDAGAPDAGPGPVNPWTVVALRGPQIPRGLFGEGAQGYAVGDLGAVWAYAAGSFSEVSHGFYGNVADLAVVGSSVFAAVNECATPACTARVGQIMTRTGPSTWAPLGGTQPFAGPVSSIAARSATDVIAGGNGELYHFDGAGWTPMPLVSAAGGPLNDLQYCGASLYGVGTSGQVYQDRSGALQSIGSLGSGDLFAIHCPNANEVWLAGDKMLFEKSGSSNFVARTSTSVNHGAWRAVWSPGQGEAFALGAERYGVYWNTADLASFDAPGGVLPDVLSGLWGSSVDNLYAVGGTITPFPFGYAVRFDGSQWRLVDSGSQRKLTAIHGSSATEIWLGAEGGGLLRAVP